jgi:hypothetical protein
MEGTSGKPRQLTPMSGELKIAADWVPPGPVPEKHRSRPEKMPPVTRRQVLLAGIRRMLIVFVLLSAAVVGAALLVIQFSDMKAARAFPLAFFLGGALIAFGGFFSAQTGQITGLPWGPGALPPERSYGFEERKRVFGNAVVYAAFGVALIVVGAVLDAYL